VVAVSAKHDHGRAGSRRSQLALSPGNGEAVG